MKLPAGDCRRPPADRHPNCLVSRCRRYGCGVRRQVLSGVSQNDEESPNIRQKATDTRGPRIVPPANAPEEHCRLRLGYGSSQKNCNTIEVTHEEKRGQSPFVRSTPAVPQRGTVPFPPRNILAVLQLFCDGRYHRPAWKVVMRVPRKRWCLRVAVRGNVRIPQPQPIRQICEARYIC